MQYPANEGGGRRHYPTAFGQCPIYAKYMKMHLFRHMREPNHRRVSFALTITVVGISGFPQPASVLQETLVVILLTSLAIFSALQTFTDLPSL